jgi:hypothetical protein
LFLRGDSRETQNIEIEVVLAKIGGGNAAEFSLGCFSNLSDINTIGIAMKRE